MAVLDRTTSAPSRPSWRGWRMSYAPIRDKLDHGEIGHPRRRHRHRDPAPRRHLGRPPAPRRARPSSARSTPTTSGPAPTSSRPTRSSSPAGRSTTTSATTPHRQQSAPPTWRPRRAAAARGVRSWPSRRATRPTVGPVAVAGAITTLEWCFRPDLAPSPEQARAEYVETIGDARRRRLRPGPDRDGQLGRRGEGRARGGQRGRACRAGWRSPRPRTASCSPARRWPQAEAAAGAARASMRSWSTARRRTTVGPACASWRRSRPARSGSTRTSGASTRRSGSSPTSTRPTATPDEAREWHGARARRSSAAAAARPRTTIAAVAQAFGR